MKRINIYTTICGYSCGCVSSESHCVYIFNCKIDSCMTNMYKITDMLNIVSNISEILKEAK